MKIPGLVLRAKRLSHLDGEIIRIEDSREKQVSSTARNTPLATEDDRAREMQPLFMQHNILKNRRFSATKLSDASDVSHRSDNNKDRPISKVQSQDDNRIASHLSH